MPPLHECNGGLGLGDYFAKTLIDALPEGDTIGLVPCAVNGKEIEYYFGHDAQVEFGKRYAKKMIELLPDADL